MLRRPPPRHDPIDTGIPAPSTAMQVSVTGKQIDIGDALRAHVAARLADGVSKYFDNAMQAHVAFSHEGPLYRTHISVHVGRGIVMESSSDSADIYESFNQAAEHVEKQLRRHKRKLRSHH